MRPRVSIEQEEAVCSNGIYDIRDVAIVKDHFWPNHYHNVLEIVAVGAGIQGKARIGSRTIRCGNANLWIVPPNTIHGNALYAPEARSMIVLWLRPEEIVRCAGRFHECSPRLLWDRSNTLPYEMPDKYAECLEYLLRLSLAKKMKWDEQQLVNPSLRSFQVHQPDDAFSDLQVLYALLGTLFKARRRQFEASIDPIIMKAIDFIEQSFAGPTSLDSISSHCAVSTGHLCRRFKQQTGSTLQQHIMRVRIAQAMSLMRDKRYHIDQAGYASGFNSAAYFSRAFRKVTGLTPSGWMKRQNL